MATEPHRWVKVVGAAFSAAAVLAALVLGVLTLLRLDSRPRTDDAYIDADVVHLAPEVSGRIVELDVTNNQTVKRGDILFRIEREPFQYRVDAASASVMALRAEVAVMKNQVASQQTQADAAQTGIGRAKAQLDLASASLARLEPLLPRGYVSAERVDRARTAKRDAEIAMVEAQQQAVGAKQKVTSIEPTQQRLSGAEADLKMAERDLRNTEVRAPCDGRVTGLETANGEYASMGKSVFTLIDTERWFAVGNFREMDLVGLAAGQRATVYALSRPRRPIDAHVESLGFGVSPDEGSESTGLPRVPRSLEWVRIAQRFPVRVVLDSPPPDLARIGASAVIVIER